MPCNSNSLTRFFGSSGSSTDCFLFGSSNKEDKYCDKKQKKICNYQVYPKRQKHETKVECCGVTKIPFAQMSSVLHDAILRHTLNNQTPVINQVDPLTLFPQGTTPTYSIELPDGTGAVTVVGELVNIDSEIEVLIPRCASSGIIIDLGELSTLANSIYQNQIKDTRLATVPGSGAHYQDGTTTQIAAGFQFLEVVAGPTGTAAFSNNDLGYDALRLMHVPEITIFNNSIHTVNVVDGYKGKTADGTSTSGGCGTGMCSSSAGSGVVRYKFEGVKSTINCKPRESLNLVFLPDKGQWRVKDSNSRW